MGMTTGISMRGPCSLASGKLTVRYGKSPCLIGKSTISMAIFNSYVTNDQRVANVTLALRRYARTL